MNEYNIPLSAAESKLTVQRSRFVGYAAQAGDKDDALNILKHRSTTHHNATHHCWAFRVGDPTSLSERSSDAGEPQGTAGMPILQQLRKANLFGIVLVVTRWFGGTKLGRGGLIRAYGTCAEDVIVLLKTETRHVLRRFSVECGYNLVGMVNKTAGRFGGNVESCEYSDKAVITIGVPIENADAFYRSVLENGAGKLAIIPFTS